MVILNHDKNELYIYSSYIRYFYNHWIFVIIKNNTRGRPNIKVYIFPHCKTF